MWFITKIDSRNVSASLCKAIADIEAQSSTSTCCEKSFKLMFSRIRKCIYLTCHNHDFAFAGKEV